MVFLIFIKVKKEEFSVILGSFIKTLFSIYSEKKINNGGKIEIDLKYQLSMKPSRYKVSVTYI